MASAGLMIVKVDYDQSVWDYNTVNNESSRQRMTIMPADNKYSEYNEDVTYIPIMVIPLLPMTVARLQRQIPD